MFTLNKGPGFVDGSRFVDSDLANIPESTVFLKLENARVSDDGVRSLPNLPKLRCIDLDSTQILDASLERISTFENLEELWIEDTAVTDVGITHLHSLKSLRFISIEYCEGISDRAVAELQKAIPDVEIH